ncbi:MAG: NTP transferase domain-containing protein [Acidaminococcaceae bacterium]
MYDAIILAGGTSPWLQGLAGTKYRSVASLGGRPMLLYIVEALCACPEIGRLVVAGPLQELTQLALPARVELVAAGSTIMATTLAALELLQTEKPVVVVTEDIPLLSAAAVTDFLRQTAKQQAELFYTIIPQDVCQKAFPGSKRTYVALKDGVFTGGNMFLATRASALQGQKTGEALYAMRKKPWQLCSWLGWAFVFKLLLRRLTLQEVELRASELLGFCGRAIVSNFAEVGMDVDKKEDWQVVERVLAARQTSPSKEMKEEA